MKLTMLVVVVVALLTIAAAFGAELELEAPLAPETLAGCVIEGGRVRLPEPLPTQEGDAPVCVEGEAFRSIRWQNPPGGVTEAADAVGGRCLTFADEAVYHVAIAREGAYTYWQRVWIPARGTWVHTAQIDDAVAMTLAFGTRPEDREGTWFWFRGGTQHLRPGVHTVAIRNLHNGKRIDRWLLVMGKNEKWTPEGQGPPATPVRRVDEGQFVSAPIAPLSLKAWKRLRAEAKGDARIEVSLGGGPFQPLPKGGQLAGLSSATVGLPDRAPGTKEAGTAGQASRGTGTAEKPLRVRVSVRRDAKGDSAEARLGAVEYLADASDFFILQNGDLRMLLDRRTGRLCGLHGSLPKAHSRIAPSGGYAEKIPGIPSRRSETFGREEGVRRYLPDGVPSTLFELEAKGEQEEKTTKLSSDDAKLVRARERRGGIDLSYELAGGQVGVEVSVELPRKDWVALLRLTVRNRSPRDIIGVTFPRLAQARAGESGSDDVLCFPSLSGRLIPRPGLAGTQKCLHPIGATFGFCDLADEKCGVMLAPLDFPMVLTEFVSQPDPGGESVTLSLTRRDRIRPGREGRFRAGVGAHEGDWHVAALWYREWFAENVGKPQIPDWVRDSDGWVTTDNVEDMSGLGFTHMQMWTETGHGACPTYYYPNPKHRSEAGFKDLAARWRALGGHLGVYFHGNSLSRSYPLADRIYGIPVADIPEAKRPPTWDWFVKNSAYGPDRKPPEKLDMSKIPEPADHEEYPGMCWQAGDWPKYLEKWAIGFYLKEYGLDTPYWDTMACYDGQDFSAHYGLHGEGRGSMARLAFLRDMQKKGSAVAPGFYQTVEGGSELLGLVAGQLESNFVANLEVARYTHPNQIYYIGHSNGWWTHPKTHLAACMAFRLNTKMDIIMVSHPAVMEVVRCRRWFAPWLNRAEFKDTDGMTLSSPEVKGALHCAADGDALAATFMNWQRIRGQKAEIDLGRYFSRRDAVETFLVRQGEEPLRLDSLPRREQLQVFFEIPSSPVSAMLFLSKPEKAEPVVQAQQLDRRVVVRVFDPSGRRRSFRARIETAEAKFKAQPELGDKDGEFIIQSPEPAEGEKPPVMFGRAIEIDGYEQLTKRLHADITLTEGRLTLKTRALVMPYFPDPDFEDPTFDAAEAHTGKRSLKIEPGGLRFFPLELVPGRRYRISVWAKRIEAVGGVYANVHHHLTNTAHTFGHGPKPNEWQKIETVYEMKAGTDQPALYLYNWEKATKPAWFDTVKVEDIGPAASK